MSFLKFLVTVLAILLGGTTVASAHVLKSAAQASSNQLPRYREAAGTDIGGGVPHGSVRDRRAAFIVEGTKWCGIGDVAGSYSDLGDHRATDACCRDHDHCPHDIRAFSSNYGMFNFRPYTINLCSCDERFRQCLLAANTTVSREVGRLFFDTLQPACFDLESEPAEQCVRWSWWGYCREYGVVRRAIVGENKPFDGEEARDEGGSEDTSREDSD